MFSHNYFTNAAAKVRSLNEDEKISFRRGQSHLNLVFSSGPQPWSFRLSLQVYVAKASFPVTRRSFSETSCTHFQCRILSTLTCLAISQLHSYRLSHIACNVSICPLYSFGQKKKSSHSSINKSSIGTRVLGLVTGDSLFFRRRLCNSIYRFLIIASVLFGKYCTM